MGGLEERPVENRSHGNFVVQDRSMAALPSRNSLMVGLALTTIAGIFLLVHVVVSTLPNGQLQPGMRVDTPGQPHIFIGFRNDDLNASSNPALEAAVLSVFRKYHISQTFSVIPNPGGLPARDAEQNLRTAPILDSLLAWHASGDISFALHGYKHLKEPQSGGEFDGLPLEEQILRLRNGKQILDRCLRTSVTMFAPPWNQADDNTIRACKSVGITTFCGYQGKTPTDGVVLVNTNAVLFHDPGYAESAHGLPSLAELLPYARSTTDTVFLLVFYHSRRDFETPGRLAELDSLLASIVHDTLITVLGIDAIARQHPAQLADHNAAGLVLLQVDEADDALKLIRMPFGWFFHLTGTDTDINTVRQHAVESYRRGEYLRANAYGGDAIRRMEHQRMWGRLFVAIVLGILVFSIIRVARGRLSGPFQRVLCMGPLICGFGIGIALVGLHLVHIISPVRTSDVTVLGSMAALALLIGGFVLCLQEKHP
jgi:hypothetical protein